MAETEAKAKEKVDELAGTEQPFVQHLVELRDRLIKIVIAIGIVAIALAIYPGPGALYDILAAPLVANLPQGATLIATSVISPFLVPLKILMMTAFLIALPVVLWQVPCCFSSAFCFVITLFLGKFSNSFKVLRLKASQQRQILRLI
jgi:Sec-independent protein secretion pathway component TatC